MIKNMASVTISKAEYTDLKARATAYERMILAAQGAFSLVPPERSKKKIVAAFKKTGKYNKEFLASLERGLGRSTQFKS